MAPTLASIAAPAPVAAPVAAPAPRKENAKEKAAIDRGLAEVHVARVRVDGLVVMKIIKHAREAHAVLPAPVGASSSNATPSVSPAVGQLLGIDADGTLEISNAFALPNGALGGAHNTEEGSTAGGGGGESRGVKAANKYTQSLLPRLADLNADASLVGFYASTTNGQHLALPGFVDALLGAQLSGGGLGSGAGRAVPTGKAAAKPAEASKSGKGIALVYDLASAAQGHVGLRAFRLTDAFLATARQGTFDTPSLIAHHLVPSTILEELPLTVRSSPLLTAFLASLPPPTAFPTLTLPSSTSATTSLLQPLHALLGALDTHQSHLSTLSFQARQLARDRSRIEQLPHVVRRRAENDQRARDGLPPLPPTDDEKALVEPSRLETMSALAAVEGAAKVLSESAGVTLVRSFAAKAGTVA